MAKKRSRSGSDKYSGYIILNGKRLKLHEHATDFTVMATKDQVHEEDFEAVAQVSAHLTRTRSANRQDRDRKMEAIRKDRVAHHVYVVPDTGEEITIDNKVILNLRREGTGELERILEEFHLEHVGRMGSAHVLRVTTATGMNPLKVANRIAERPEVAACSPQVMLDLQFHQAELFPEQWYLTTDLASLTDVIPGADIRAPETWQLESGKSEIVVAVIDDGFDLGHPAFSGTTIHPERRDFMGQDVTPHPGP